MTSSEAVTAAKEILGRRAGQPSFVVLVDSPNDCKTTISAFKTLGCKVKSENDGTKLTIFPSTEPLKP